MSKPPSPREVVPIDARLALFGFGAVGQALARSLSSAPIDGIRVVAAQDSTHTCHRSGGLYPGDLADRKSRSGTLPGTGPTVAELVADDRVDIVVDLSPTDLLDGEPSRRLLRRCRRRGVAVVTANKGPVAVDPKLRDRFQRADVPLGVEATVGGGMPVLSTLDRLDAGDRVTAVTGTLNGSTSRILAAVEEGRSVDDAVRAARRAGTLEADASLDLDGWDAAAKAAIVAQVAFDAPVTVDDVDRTGVRGLDGDEIRWSAGKGQVTRLVATVTQTRCRVAPVSLDGDDPLAASGHGNAIRVELAHGEEVLLAGPGAGPGPTATALRRDLVATLDELRGERSDPDQPARRRAASVASSTPDDRSTG